jgi:hypothetical protein
MFEVLTDKYFMSGLRPTPGIWLMAPKISTMLHCRFKVILFYQLHLICLVVMIGVYVDLPCLAGVQI